MDPRPCVVIKGDDRWAWRVLAWRRDRGGWHGLVRFSRVVPAGYPLTFEHWRYEADLEPG